MKSKLISKSKETFTTMKGEQTLKMGTHALSKEIFM